MPCPCCAATAIGPGTTQLFERSSDWEVLQWYVIFPLFFLLFPLSPFFPFLSRQSRTTLTNVGCADVIASFITVAKIEDMPTAEICSYCWLQHHATLQQSSYSACSTAFKTSLLLQYALPPPAISLPPATDFWAADNLYTAAASDTCDSIAAAKNASSAADTCFSVEQLSYNVTGRLLAPGDLARYNPLINPAYDNLHAASDAAFGHGVCLGPPNGIFAGDPVPGDTTVPHRSNGYSFDVIAPPTGSVVAA